MNIQENRSVGVASNRHSVYDERRRLRSPATVAGDRRSSEWPALLDILVDELTWLSTVEKCFQVLNVFENIFVIKQIKGFKKSNRHLFEKRSAYTLENMSITL